jgi:hypothetical protein
MRVENVDPKGNIVRIRNLDQTEFDRLALVGDITPDQFQAGQQFSSACWKAGGFVKAVNWGRTGGSAGNSHERRAVLSAMAAAEPLHYMQKNCGRDVAGLVVRVAIDQERCTGKALQDLRGGLDALVRYYSAAIKRKQKKRAAAFAAALSSVG